MHEDEWDAALEAFDSACSRENAQNKEAVKEFVAATKAASSGKLHELFTAQCVWCATIRTTDASDVRRHESHRLRFTRTTLGDFSAT